MNNKIKKALYLFMVAITMVAFSSCRHEIERPDTEVFVTVYTSINPFASVKSEVVVSADLLEFFDVHIGYTDENEEAQNLDDVPWIDEGMDKKYIMQFSYDHFGVTWFLIPYYTLKSAEDIANKIIEDKTYRIKVAYKIDASTLHQVGVGANKSIIYNNPFSYSIDWYDTEVKGIELLPILYDIGSNPKIGAIVINEEGIIGLTSLNFLDIYEEVKSKSKLSPMEIESRQKPFLEMEVEN